MAELLMPRPGPMGLSIVLLFLTVACDSSSTPALATSVSSPATSASTPAPPQFESVGHPAITPTHAEQAMPTFDEADVRAYVLAHPNVSQGLNPGPTVVDSIEFMSQRELRARFGAGANLGKPDDVVLCVVTVHGMFLQAPESTSASLQTKRVVFDGRTGNELMLMGGPDASAR